MQNNKQDQSFSNDNCNKYKNNQTKDPDQRKETQQGGTELLTY